MRRPDVVLRDVHDTDLALFFEYQRDVEATGMAAVPARESEAFHDHWRRIRRDESVVIRTVLVDGEVAGNILSFPKDGRREVGYWLGRAFWGRGIATRALELFVEQLDERPLYAYVARHNTASMRVLEKCGFARLEEADDGVLLARER